MNRLLIGLVVGWLAARRYYTAELDENRELTGRRERSLRDRVHAMAGEAKDVVRELADEAKAAAKIEGDNLDDKLQRIKNAAES